jgi:hypothetical protein
VGRLAANPVQLPEVGKYVEFLSREYSGALVVYDRHQAVEITQRLERRNVKTEEFVFSASSVGRLALTVYQLLRSRSLSLPDDEELLDELANVRLRETSPGTYRMDHDPDKHDDMAVALALAAHYLVERGGRQSGGGVSGAVDHSALARKRREEAMASPDLREGDVIRISDDTKRRAELETRRAKEGTKGKCYYCRRAVAAASTICPGHAFNAKKALAAWRARQQAA